MNRYDPESLSAVTDDLQGTTRKLSRYAPRAATGFALPEPASSRAVAQQAVAAGSPGGHTYELYEDGHTSRSEDAFRRQMGMYRVALKQQRAMDLAKARR